MRMRTFQLSLVLALTLAPSGLAQMPATFQKGFAPEQVYHFNELDHVNLFNGNLVVTLPIGPKYGIGGGTEYGMTLVYNGQAWEHLQVPNPDPNRLPTDPAYRTLTIPNRRSNTGFGWSLHFGRIIPKYDESNNKGGDIFEDFSGAENEITCELFGFICASGPVVRGSSTFSIDGSYLRTKSGLANVLEVDKPNGIKYTFYPDGVVSRIEDALGNAVNLTETTSGNGSPIWTITDQIGGAGLGRTTTVTFRPVNGVTSFTPPQSTGPVSFANYQNVIDTIAFNSNFGQMIYKFVYDQDASGNVMPTKIKADCFSDASGVPSYAPVYPTAYQVPVLRAVQILLGTPTTTPTLYEQYSFTYAINPQFNNELGSCAEGVLFNMGLPTGGSLAWDYGNYSFPIDHCRDTPFFHTVSGVTTRQFLDTNGASISTWSYAQNLIGGQSVPSCGSNAGQTFQYQGSTTTLTKPDGSKEIHYFSAYGASDIVADSNGSQDWEFGLNAYHGIKDASGNFLATEYIDPTSANGTSPVKRSYAVYERDPSADPADQALRNNIRIRRENTVYLDDCPPLMGCRYAQTVHSDFDGFGHYRQTDYSGNFDQNNALSGTVDANNITEYTDYNPGTDAAGNRNGVFAFADTDPWIIGLYDFHGRTDGTNSHRVDACFDPLTGLLGSSRTRAGTAATIGGVPLGPHDTVAMNTYVGGNLTNEQYFAGDAQSVQTSGACSGSGLTTPEYEIRHEYTNQVQSMSIYRSNGSDVEFKSLDLVVDSFGMITASRDTAGVQTGYSYDAMGRPLAMTPPSGFASTQFAYPSPTFLTMTHGDVSKTFALDSIGRLVTETANYPVVNSGGAVVSATATRATSYDSSNRKSRVYNWDETGTPTKFTTYTYDGFDRPTSATAADGAVVSTSYTGVSAATVMSSVNTGTSVPAIAFSPATTTKTFDRFGQLIQVTEPNGVATRYVYDIGRRLQRVCGKYSLTGAPCQQLRVFTYDNRGFLTAEQHPELPSTLMGETSSAKYTYDSRGHMLTKSVPVPSNQINVFDLTYEYDKAERLLNLRARNPNQPNPLASDAFRLLKEFRFGQSNDPVPPITVPNLQLGKLASAKRHNYNPALGDIAVTETFFYEDAAGHLTRRRTNIRRNEVGIDIQNLEQSQTYNSLELPEEIHYPKCDPSFQTPCAQDASQFDFVTQYYTAARLSSIPGFVGSIGYHPSGTVGAITHGNGVVDTYAEDSSTKIPRPSLITFGSLAGCIPAAITVPPPGQTISAGSSATLTVTAAGTSPVSYQWYLAQGIPTLIQGATQATYVTDHLQATSDYRVVVYNACGRSEADVTVTVSTCTSPTISVPPQPASIAGGQSVQLSVVASGTATLHYQWYQLLNGVPTAVGTDSSSFTTGSLYASTSYKVRVTNNCGSFDSTYANISVTLATPGALVATASGLTTSTVSWTASAGADHYVLERRANGSAFGFVANVSGLSYGDASLAANTTYVYRVKAVDAAGQSASVYSNSDLATTMQFSVLSPPVTHILLSHLTELLSAVNAVRACSGQAAESWSQVLAANGAGSTPVPSANGRIYAQHILSLRKAMDDALVALGLSTSPYTDPTLGPIKAIHVQELRSRTQ